MLEIAYVKTAEETKKLKEKGYVPIECSFGGETVAFSEEFPFDHHGKYSSLPAVAVQAVEFAKTSFFKKHGPFLKFAVTGAPDADACYAIAVLSGTVKPDMEIAKKIEMFDVDPIGRDILAPEHALLLHFRYQMQDAPWNEMGFLRGVVLLEYLIEKGGVKDKLILEAAKECEIERRKIAKQKIVKVENHIALVKSPVWGFDIWYQEAAVVIAYNEEAKRITIGGNPYRKSEERPLLYEKSVFDILGQEGLKAVYPILGEGWGGRETIGGSPRGKEMKWRDAVKCFKKIKKYIKNKGKIK